MKHHKSILAVAVLVLASPLPQAQQQDEPRPHQERHVPDEPRLTLRPTTIANAIDTLAGQKVRVVNAKVVGVFEPRAFLIEDGMRDEMPLGLRDRVLVLIETGALQATPEQLVESNVVVIGAARTLLGLRVSHEVPWPPKLDRNLIERLEIRAAVLATSVQTPEGNLLGGR